uniref:Hcy-binding domain-containing protein n=1 Tax=Syphacia muris TaxID=451379 RepID=A0A0N5ARJ2_9BILA
MYDEQSRWSKLRVLDGGFGTELENSGFSLKANLQFFTVFQFRMILYGVQGQSLMILTWWSTFTKGMIRFILAGARVILTNSYHANIRRMMENLQISKNDATRILAKSVELAIKAVNESGTSEVEVIGSVGPYATTLSDCSEYNGHYVDEVSETVLVDHYIEQTAPLLQAGLKMFAFETIPAVVEVKAVLVALDKLNADMKCWISLACQDGENTTHNDSFKSAANIALAHPKVVGIGINCTHPSYVVDLLKSIDGCLNGKIAVVYPNSGSWNSTASSAVTKETVREWKNLGVRLIGGCCGVTPEMIGILAEYVHQLETGV